MSFYRYPRASLRASAAAVALPAVMTLAYPMTATAADWKDVEVAPGHTVTLDSAPGRTFSVNGDDAAPLPAGWSVITQKGALRITAPATASPSEFATVQVTEGSGETETFRVTVDDGDGDESGHADEVGDHPTHENAPSSSGGASAWLERLAGRVASLFGG